MTDSLQLFIGISAIICSSSVFLLVSMGALWLLPTVVMQLKQLRYVLKAEADKEVSWRDSDGNVYDNPSEAEDAEIDMFSGDVPSASWTGATSGLTQVNRG